MVRVEELLIAKGFVRPADMECATERRRVRGEPITKSLLALSLVTPDQVDAALRMTPPSAPASVNETGIRRRTLLSLLLKGLHRAGADTLPALVDMLRLPGAVVSSLLQDAVERDLLKVTGSDARSALPVLTYSLTAAGRVAVAEAWDRDRYVGPAPVSLKDYSERVMRQRLRFDAVEPQRLREAFSALVLTEELVDAIGPAVNAGRSILLYGPPGNGKSSLAKGIGRIFSDTIYVPYCVEVEGQIVQVFDPNVHEPVARAEAAAEPGIEIRQDEGDRRWVGCRRPVVVTGGEFTLDMLELRYLEGAGFYEAPLHVKAMGGTFIIDDFGRQLARPRDLLNRWMIPLEEKHDYLRLHTGATFSLPFDELVIFCTNLAPGELMDMAFLRRIPYKIRLGAPSRERYREIFERAARRRGLVFPEPLFDWLVAELQERRQVALACYQPTFIIDHIFETCRFRARPAEATQGLIASALDNLYATGC